MNKNYINYRLTILTIYSSSIISTVDHIPWVKVGSVLGIVD